MSLFIVALIVVFTIAVAAIIYFYFKPKPVSAIKVGDYVMFKRRFKDQFPNVPTTHALVVEHISNGKATIVFMTVKSQILKEVVPIECIVRAS